MTRDYAAEIRARLPEARKERAAAAAAEYERRKDRIREAAAEARANPIPDPVELHSTEMDWGHEGPFGFNVYHYADEGRYSVFLDHQCDWWQISDRSVTKDEAIASLEAFIAEAQTALAALKEAP